MEWSKEKLRYKWDTADRLRVYGDIAVVLTSSADWRQRSWIPTYEKHDLKHVDDKRGSDEHE